MADTNFIAGTVITSAWLNDVNDHVYNGNSYDDISIVNVLDPSIGFVNDGVTDNATALAALLASGKSRIYVPKGTYALASPVTVSLTTDVYIFGEGKFIYTGTNNTNPLITIQCVGYSLNINGPTFDGDDKIAGGFRIENTNAMSDNDPVCVLNDCKLLNFRMNSASIWNNGAYIAGSFAKVSLFNNQVTNITRAAGTGTPGSNGTAGIQVSQYDSSRYVRFCEHRGNIYTNVTGDDLLASANNVDFDGMKFFGPLPSGGQYTPAVLASSDNTFHNCRGRALKVQAIGSATRETVIRDADYTINGGSVEINFQLGVGIVTDCTFIYRPYNSGASSPIQSGVVLVGFFQGSDYGEDTGSAIVNGIQVINSVGSGVGSRITAIVDARVGSGVATPAKPLVSVSNVTVNKNAIDWIALIGYESTTYGTLRIDNAVVPGLTYAAVGTNGADTNFDIIATNVVNIDGLTTPANAKPFVTDTVGSAVDYGGMISGGLNHGFVQNYNVGADLNRAPMLHGAALADPAGRAGGAVSVQSQALANDASFTFDRRFFNSGRGLIIVSVNFDYTTQGMFAIGSNGVYSIAAHGSNVFSASTTGSNLDTANRLNLWFTGGALNVKNRLGDSYVVTVVFIG